MSDRRTIAPARTGGRTLLWVAVGAAVAIAAVTAVVVVSAGETSPGANLVSSAKISANSTVFGGTAAALADNPSESGSSQGGKEWAASGDGIGASIDFSWSPKARIGRVVVENARAASGRVASGYLSFDDGSSLSVGFPSDGSPVDLQFSPRDIGRMTFTISALGTGSTKASLSEVRAYSSGDASASSRDGVDGNAAPEAAVTSSGSDATGLTDGSGEDPGKSWMPSRPGEWAQLEWPTMREIANVELAGIGDGEITHASLEFGDGTTVPVGAIVSGHPTSVAFMPRVTDRLRLTIGGVHGRTADHGIEEFKVMTAGSEPADRAAVERNDSTDDRSIPSCPSKSSVKKGGSMVVLCPTPTSEVEGPTQIVLVAPGLRRIEAHIWLPNGENSDQSLTATPDDADGIAKLNLDADSVAHGPFTVRIQGFTSPDAGASPTADDVVYLQLYNRGGHRSSAAPTPSRTASAMTLAYDEQFSSPLSITRDGDGATYSAAKPTAAGMQDFGDAIFADPALGYGNVEVVDDYLRIAVSPLPRGRSDPQGWDRTHIGGLLSSARDGGSGFSAQYGYFEARMLVPVGAGTWPAFWMLPNDNLIDESDTVAEIDAVELYGHDPTGACHSTHEYISGQDEKNIQCGTRFRSIEKALAWHLYGVRVTPDEIRYYIDDELVATAPQVAGGDSPMFFMVDLALGGGWPIDLTGTGDRVAMYVDYIRVYT